MIITSPNKSVNKENFPLQMELDSNTPNNALRRSRSKRSTKNANVTNQSFESTKVFSFEATHKAKDNQFSEAVGKISDMIETLKK